MERNETTVCEKLFNVFNMHPSFRPLSRLTFRQQPDHAAAAVHPNSPPTISDHSPPPPPPPAPKPNPPAPIVSTKVDIVPPPAASAPVPKERAQQLPGVLSKAGSNSTQVSIPTPTAPPGAQSTSSRPAETMPPPRVKTEVAIPQPAPPLGAEKARRSVNDKAEDYIARARNKMRAGSGIGRAPSSK